MATTLLAAAFTLALSTTPAMAAGSDPGDGASDDGVYIGITGSTAGPSLVGLLPPTGPSAPTDLTYPTADPAGYTPVARDTAVLDAETLKPAGDTLQLYGVEANATPGANYEAVSRAAYGNVNAGFVATVVYNSYPSVSGIAAPGNFTAPEMIAATQAVIWWYTDGFVLSTSDPLHAAVAWMVTVFNGMGPTADDVTTPGLELTGPTDFVAPGELAGPFTVESDGATTHTVDAGPATMYRDAEGTKPVPAGDELPVGTPFWVGSDAAGAVDVTATSNVVTQPGQFYMSGDENQVLVSATDWTHSATITATIEFTDSSVTPTGSAPPATSAPSTATPSATTPSSRDAHTPGTAAPVDLALSGDDGPLIATLGGIALFALAAGAAVLIALRTGSSRSPGSDR